MVKARKKRFNKFCSKKMFCFLTLKVQTFNFKKTYTKYEGFPSFFKEITGKYMISHVDVVLVVPLFNLLTLISFFKKSQLKFKGQSHEMDLAFDDI
jgi:hypothetical protein